MISLFCLLIMSKTEIGKRIRNIRILNGLSQSELGEKLGLKKEELAFYEALAQNQSARELMGDEVLSKLAKEITDTLRRSVTIDWQYKEGVRAKMRILVKRALQRYKYPPDKQEEAVSYVIKQAEEIAEDLTAEKSL